MQPLKNRLSHAPASDGRAPTPSDLPTLAPTNNPGGIRHVKKFSDQIYERIMASIVAGELPAGEKLPSESQLADMFGVSRPVIREALARLRADGVVMSRHGSGTFVQRKPAVDFLQLAPLGEMADVLRAYEYRVALEGEAAFLAAERRTETDLRHLAVALKDMQQALEDGKIGAEADLRFHRAIAVATKNQLFEFSMQSLGEYIGEGVALTRKLSLKVGRARLELVQHEHELIYKAVRARDCDSARGAMRTHIDNARSRMLTEDADRH